MPKLSLAIAIGFVATASTATAGIQKLLKPMQHMQRVMGAERIVKHPPAYHWYKQVFNAYMNPPHKSAWLCIHRFEGSWKDDYAPYYGGLQMDEGFQKTWGRYLFNLKGTANHWNPIEQMWVAEKAHRTRGFYPWPNTARSCGLI